MFAGASGGDLVAYLRLVFVYGLFLGLFNSCCGLLCVVCLSCLVWVICYCVGFVWLLVSCLVVFGYCIYGWFALAWFGG